MSSLPLQQYFPKISRLAYGCMGLGGGWNSAPISKNEIKQAHEVIDAALMSGINFFDHADIYTNGKAEQVFGQVLKERPSLDEHIILQSKCGIRFGDKHQPTYYDFSSKWINESVENTLSRLNIETLDILLLHRPDQLMVPEEVAKTLSALRADGKVKHFGVSNMNQHQMALLNAYLDEPLVVNQLQMSLNNHTWLDHNVTVGMNENANAGFSAGTVEYCQLNNVQIQAWGSLSQGLFSGKDVSNETISVQNTAKLVEQLAQEYQTTAESILLAWLIKHPANIQPVIGTTNLERINGCADAERVAHKLSRAHWYKLYVTARGTGMP